MGFKVKNENPLPDLVELKARVEGDDLASVNANIRVELGIFPYEIEDRIGTIAVSFTEVTLSLDLRGFDPVPLTKFGQTLVGSSRREIVTERSKAATLETKAEGKLAINAKLSPVNSEAGADFAVGGSAGASASTALKENENVVLEHQPVRARGNNNWIVQAAPGEALDGTYIDHAILCSVAPIWGANERYFSVTVFAKQKHAKFSLSPRQSVFSFSLPPNQKRIAGIVMAKTLHERATDAPFEGAICLAHSEASDED